MRPIIRRSKLFTDKELDHDSDSDSGRRNRRKKVVASGSQGGEAVARRHARIPEALTTAFKVAPKEKGLRDAGSGQLQGHSATGVTTKMKSYKKRLVAGQAANRRV